MGFSREEIGQGTSISKFTFPPEHLDLFSPTVQATVVGRRCASYGCDENADIYGVLLLGFVVKLRNSFVICHSLVISS